MSERAWMPLDIDDYLADTTHLSAAEHGAYMLLIMRYWKDGGLPTDERMIQRYSRLTPDQWAESRDVLAAFFDEGWTHKRIDAELARAAEIIAKRKAAAVHRHSKSNAPAVHVQSKSTYVRVPPSTDNQEQESPPTPQGGGVDEVEREFDESLWRDFPRHKNSRRFAALKAYRRLKPAERVDCIRGAARYSIRFDDDKADKRPMPERLRYVPHLSTWINQRGWETELETA